MQTVDIINSKWWNSKGFSHNHIDKRLCPVSYTICGYIKPLHAVCRTILLSRPIPIQKPIQPSENRLLMCMMCTPSTFKMVQCKVKNPHKWSTPISFFTMCAVVHSRSVGLTTEIRLWTTYLLMISQSKYTHKWICNEIKYDDALVNVSPTLKQINCRTNWLIQSHLFTKAAVRELAQWLSLLHSPHTSTHQCGSKIILQLKLQKII